jgi:hypothetical protein
MQMNNDIDIPMLKSGSHGEYDETSCVVEALSRLTKNGSWQYRIDLPQTDKFTGVPEDLRTWLIRVNDAYRSDVRRTAAFRPWLVPIREMVDSPAATERRRWIYVDDVCRFIVPAALEPAAGTAHMPDEYVKALRDHAAALRMLSEVIDAETAKGAAEAARASTRTARRAACAACAACAAYAADAADVACAADADVACAAYAAAAAADVAAYACAADADAVLDATVARLLPRLLQASTSP